MTRTSRRWLVSAHVVVLALGAGPAAALTAGAYHCELLGGNGILVDFQLAPQGSNAQGDVFSLIGQWDDASLTPLLPIYGSVLTDPNFGVVGGFTHVGFRPNAPLPGAPFAARPAGIHVQFRLTEPTGRDEQALVGRWADNRGNSGRMRCLLQP